MASTTPRPASPQTGPNDSIVTILYTIEGILKRATNHYLDPAYCGQEPKGHGIGQHKDELKAIPSRLEAILNSGISDDEWLAIIRELGKIVKYATAEKFDLENQKWFKMLTDDVEEIYKRVLRIDDANRTATRPPIYYEQKSQSGGEGFETSKA